ncbi:MAG: VOC family protein [Actinomycetes bacterium]
MSLITNIYSAIDCSNPVNLARFYSGITGLRLDLSSDDDEQKITWVELKDNSNNTKLAFQKIPNYRQPTWPEGNIPQQIHLDFFVNDIKDVEDQVLKLGATKTDFQPGSPPEEEVSLEFRVYLDPEGHPFCLIFKPE